MQNYKLFINNNLLLNFNEYLLLNNILSKFRSFAQSEIVNNIFRLIRI